VHHPRTSHLSVICLRPQEDCKGITLPALLTKAREELSKAPISTRRWTIDCLRRSRKTRAGKTVSGLACTNAGLVLLLSLVLLVQAIPAFHGLDPEEMVYVNPFTGDKSGLLFHGLDRSGPSAYALFTVTGFADTAAGRYSRDFPVSVEVKVEGNATDLTPAIAEAAAREVRLSAEGVRERIQSLYLWTGEDEERFVALNDFLFTASSLFKEGRVPEGAYMMREALRLLLMLEGHLSAEMRIDYVQGPSMILMLALFSFFLARLFSTTRWRSLTVLIFAAMVLAFAGSHPYMRIFFYQVYSFLAEYPRLFERPDYLILNMMLVVSPFFILLVFLKTWRQSSHSLLDQTIRGMKARRLRSILALTTIVVVGVASMIHSAVLVTRAVAEEDLPYRPTVAYGLVAFKYALEYLTTEEPGGHIMSIPSAEALWLSKAFGYESSAYGIKKVLVGGSTSSYGELNLATMNLTFAERYSAFTLLSGALPQPQNSGDWVIVSQELIDDSGVRVGDDLLVEGRPLKIVGTYSRAEATRLVDVDGYPLFTRVEGERPQPNPGEAVDLITGYDVFRSMGSEFTKVSMVLDVEDRGGLEGIVQRLLAVETDVHQRFVRRISYGPVIYRISGFTYLFHVVKGGVAKEVLPVGFTVQVEGSWAAQTVVIAIGAGIIYTTAMAVVYEKRKDFKVMSIVGAKPSFITLSLLSEGIFLGVIGGVLSYGLGYITIWSANLLCPGNVPALPSGLFHMILVVTLGVLTTTAGYLMPAREAIRLVIPSGLLRRDVGEVVGQDREKIALRIPLRAHRDERPLLEAFFLSKFPSLFPPFLGGYGLAINSVRENEDPSGMAFVYEASYTPVSTSRQPIRLQLTVRADKDADHLALKATVESSMLRRFSRLDLKDVLLEIRRSILSYVDWKRTKEAETSGRKGVMSQEAVDGLTGPPIQPKVDLSDPVERRVDELIQELMKSYDLSRDEALHRVKSYIDSQVQP